MFDALVVMRPFGGDLVLQFDRRRTRRFEFPDRATGVQCVAEANAAIDDQRDGGALCDLTRRRRDLSNRQQRLRDGELEAQAATAEICGSVAEMRNRAGRKRVEADWGEDGTAVLDRLAKRAAGIHSSLLAASAERCGRR